MTLITRSVTPFRDQKINGQGHLAAQRPERKSAISLELERLQVTTFRGHDTTPLKLRPYGAIEIRLLLLLLLAPQCLTYSLI